MLIEAVLHLLDGNDVAYVAKRYCFSEPYLHMIVRGKKRPAPYQTAVAIYQSYRLQQAA